MKTASRIFLLPPKINPCRKPEPTINFKDNILSASLFAFALVTITFLWNSFSHAIFSEDVPPYRWILLTSFTGYICLFAVSHAARCTTAWSQGQPFPPLFPLAQKSGICQAVSGEDATKVKHRRGTFLEKPGSKSLDKISSSSSNLSIKRSFSRKTLIPKYNKYSMFTHADHQLVLETLQDKDRKDPEIEKPASGGFYPDATFNPKTFKTRNKDMAPRKYIVPDFPPDLHACATDGFIPHSATKLTREKKRKDFDDSKSIKEFTDYQKFCRKMSRRFYESERIQRKNVAVKGWDHLKGSFHSFNLPTEDWVLEEDLGTTAHDRTNWRGINTDGVAEVGTSDCTDHQTFKAYQKMQDYIHEFRHPWDSRKGKVGHDRNCTDDNPCEFHRMKMLKEKRTSTILYEYSRSTYRRIQSYEKEDYCSLASYSDKKGGKMTDCCGRPRLRRKNKGAEKTSVIREKEFGTLHISQIQIH